MSQAKLDTARAASVERAKAMLDRGRPLMEVSTFLHIRHVDLSDVASREDLEYDGLHHDDSGRPL